jgi:hypothetical protein
MRLPFCVIDKKIDFRHTTGAYLLGLGSATFRLRRPTDHQDH